MPVESVATYEALRARILRGEASAEGLGAITFHGLLRGMQIVLAKPCEPVKPVARADSSASVAIDGALVRVLANMVLQVHSELRHVY